MSAFKFNFCRENDSSDKTDNSTRKEEIQCLETVEVMPQCQLVNLDKIAAHANMFVCGDVEIGHIIAKEALLHSREIGSKNAIELAEKEHSDLVAGKYEGGLKIWECTYDLIEYLSGDHTKINFKNLKVLDLGCGAGILGIYALLNGADVTFQDYNKEVLECVTIPNVLLNIEEEDREFELTKCKFFSGDWTSFNKKLPETELFDVILSSETIYNTENYDKLIDLFLDRLSKEGLAYIAAKTYYFGVGGGTREFEKSLQKHTLLKSEVSWKSYGGIQREIIKLSRNKDLYLID